MTKSTISTIVLEDEEEYIEKLRIVCEEFRRKKGVPYMVLLESGLDAFEKEGRLISGCLSDKKNRDVIDTYAIETCLDTLKKETYIKENINPYFSLEKVYYKGLADGELPFDNGCDEKVLRLLLPNTEDVFLCEFGFDVYKFPEAYRFLAYQTAYLKYYYSEQETDSENLQSKIEERKVQRALEIYTSYEVMENRGLEDGEIGLVYDWNDVDFTATLLERKNDEVQIFWQESIEDLNALLVDEVRAKMREIMMEDEEVLQILKLDETNTKVWEKFYDDTSFVIHQLLQEQYAELKLESYLASVTNEFPQEVFDKIVEKYYFETQSLIVNILQRAGYQLEDVSKIYLSGMWSQSKVVKDKLYELFEL